MGYVKFDPNQRRHRAEDARLLVRRGGRVTFNKAALALLGIEKGGRFDIYVDEQRRKVGFDPHPQGSAVVGPGGACMGLTNAWIAVQGDCTPGKAYPLSKCELLPVRFEVTALPSVGTTAVRQPPIGASLGIGVRKVGRPPKTNDLGCEPDWDEILERYVAGESLYSLAPLYGLSYQRLKYHARTHKWDAHRHSVCTTP